MAVYSVDTAPGTSDVTLRYVMFKNFRVFFRHQGQVLFFNTVPIFRAKRNLEFDPLLRKIQMRGSQNK